MCRILMLTELRFAAGWMSAPRNHCSSINALTQISSENDSPCNPSTLVHSLLATVSHCCLCPGGDDLKGIMEVSRDVASVLLLLGSFSGDCRLPVGTWPPRASYL
ncbi:hypothetical protein MLD38_016075 [Melastoma candidum]|uniref:Uncharacterized protein n=1 Tax=Melastoma candidum TaxID=119954 RepID=A0ACB9RIU4_9MYRT|nr:hypothetical protein MLD38_016075 [Melastoma candidum]